MSTMPAQPPPPLTAFTLFPKLPFDLRLMIWRAAMSPPRIVFPEVIVDHTNLKEQDPEDYEYVLWQGWEPDEHARTIAAVDEELNEQLKDFTFFCRFQQGQGQLERYGFTSSRAQPEIRKTIEALRTEHHRTHVVAGRVAEVLDAECHNEYALKHVCRESLDFMISCGYGWGLSTYTKRGRIWFNFKEDILIPEKVYYLDEDSILDGGSYNLGQCPRNELERVRKLALRIHRPHWGGHTWEDARHPRTVPDVVHEAIQLFGDLEELNLVIQCWFDDNMYKDFAPGGAIFADVGLEEIWDHHHGWRTQGRYGYSSYYHTGAFIGNLNRNVQSLDDIARDIETQIRTHAPVVGPMIDPKRPVRLNWTTPKVRFVVLVARDDEKSFLESRKKYRAWIDEMYWKKVVSTDPPSNTGLDTDRPFKWFSEARKALHPESEGWASPYTMEWTEAREAADDMDSYPEGTWFHQDDYY